MRILIAEDDTVSRVLMQHTLRKFGYDVVLAEDGRKAAEILSLRDGPRLALIDWMMPELDGLALCREIRSRHRDDAYIYILLLTAKQNSEDIVAGLEAGADDYITKPFQPAELRARLQTGRRILSLEQKLIDAREDMRFKATYDALTKLLNRASILSVVHAEMDRAIREQTSLSVLLCDVDHFKRINDLHGHLTGDLVLQEVAKRLIGAVRPYDAVGRYGGEEFLILLKDCNPGCLQTRSEDIRSAIASCPIETGGEPLSVSVSIGALSCEKPGANFPIERILARADGALYRAKADGRNRTVLAESLVIA